jgi:type VI secretion system Hcp family effector
MYLDAAVMDMDEALRTLEIVGTKAGQLDLVMQVTGSVQGDVVGESIREYRDKKPRLDILGYYLSAGTPSDSESGQAAGRRRYSAMRVVRNSDATTSSLLKAFSRNEELTVELASYRAGGDKSDKADPLFRIEMKKVRVKTFTVMMGGSLPGVGAVEIIELTFREITIVSAPQTATGQRGGARTFQDTLSTQS